MGFVTSAQFKDELKAGEKWYMPLIQAQGRLRLADLYLRTKHNSSSNNKNWLRLRVDFCREKTTYRWLTGVCKRLNVTHSSLGNTNQTHETAPPS